MKTAQFARLRIAAIAIVALAALTPAAGLRAATLVVPRGWQQSPSGWEHFDGNTDSGGPFNIGAFGLSSFRQQQVYSAGAFPPLPMTISQIAFRPDAVKGAAFESTLPNVQISLSTTIRGVNDLSPAFADNVGPNETVVHSGPLALSSAFTGPAGGPMDFDIVIDLAEPFVYDPRQGHLLMDVRNYGGGVTTQFDSVGDPNGYVSWVVDHTDADSTVALGGGPIGLVTRFTYEYAEKFKEYKYEFTGQIDLVDDELNWFNDSFAVGMPVKGTFNLFDPGFQYGAFEDGSSGTFNYSNRWPNSYGLPPLPVNVTVEIDGQTYEKIVEPWNIEYSVQLSNDRPGPSGPDDVYGIWSQMAIPPHFVDGAQEIENYRPWALLGLTFVDSTGTAFGPLYPGASPELILLDPARYDSMSGGISILNFQGLGEGYMPAVRFQITSLRLVPEPAGFALAAGPLAAVLFARRRRAHGGAAGSPPTSEFPI